MTNKSLFSFEASSPNFFKVVYTKNILQGDYICLEYSSSKLLTLTCSHVYLQCLEEQKSKYWGFDFP